MTRSETASLAADHPDIASRELWKVLVVEDDRVIGSVYRRAVAAFGGLEVVGTVTRGEDAVEFLRHRHVDLILLDLRLGGMSGLKLLHELRIAGDGTEVIVLTATRTSTVVRAAIQRGAIDYVLKPFTVDRLHQSLSLFLTRATALRDGELDQAAVDLACAGGRVLRRSLPKGLTEQGVTLVHRALNSRSAPTSSADLATTAGMSRVTARRYLEYLVTVDQATVEANPSGPGRPRKLYALKR